MLDEVYIVYNLLPKMETFFPNVFVLNNKYSEKKIKEIMQN